MTDQLGQFFAEVRELAENATPRPWQREPIFGGDAQALTAPNHWCRIAEAATDDEHETEHNFDYIVAAANLVPKLMELVELYRELLAIGGICFDAGNYSEGALLNAEQLTKQGDALRTRIDALVKEMVEGSK